jgi:hypothetical protein
MNGHVPGKGSVWIDYVSVISIHLLTFAYEASIILLGDVLRHVRDIDLQWQIGSIVMRRVPVKAASYRNKWGTLVNRRASYRRIRGSGASRKPTRRAKAPAIAITVTVTLGAGIATAAISSTSGGAAAGQAADAQPLSANVSMADFKNARSNLLAIGFQHVDFAEESDSSCEPHSYGQVRKFFRSHPCAWLVRAYLAVHDGNLGVVLVALSWVGMPDVSTTAEYKKLIDTGSAGNVTELSRNIGPYRRVKYDGRFHTSGLDVSSVWNVQLQPVGAIPTAFVLSILDKFKQ